MTQLFKTEPLTKTEEDLLTEIFSQSVMQKYLRMLALGDTVELLRLGSINRSDAEIGKALATVQGKLSVYETLLSVGVPASNQPVSQT